MASKRPAMGQLRRFHRRWGMALWASVLLHAIASWFLLQAHLADPEADPETRLTEATPILEVVLVEQLYPPEPPSDRTETRLESRPDPMPESPPLEDPTKADASAPPEATAASSPAAATGDADAEEQDSKQSMPEQPGRNWAMLIRRGAAEATQEQPYKGIPDHLNMPGSTDIPLTGGAEPRIFKGQWAPETVEVEYLGVQDGIHLGVQDGIQRKVVRYPDGTTLCGERRVPDPSDSFDVSIYAWHTC